MLIHSIRYVLPAVLALCCHAAYAQHADGALPMYPGGHNLNQMPANAVAAGVPMVLETTDAVGKVDAWYGSNAPKSCARSSQAEAVKYACSSGSIMIYQHAGKTQIALVPALGGLRGR